MKRFLISALLVVSGCTEKPAGPTPRPIDTCADLAKVTVTAIPARVRVRGASTLAGAGGSTRFTYRVVTNRSGATLSDDRYFAGLTPGIDTVAATDSCGSAGTANITVTAAFEVKPVRATIKPGTQFTIAVAGMVGAAIFKGEFASGGSVSSAGLYVAGPSAGLDLVTVRDSSSGEQALLQFTVSPNAQFKAVSAKLALPTGAVVPLETLEGSGEVKWVISSGPGSVSADGTLYQAPEEGGGDVTLEAIDAFTQETLQVKIRILTELKRPNRAQGRRSDTATAVAGDFDGDGLTDLAIGSQESDLARPQGGAVFIFRGSASGLAATPAWTILPNTDTANLGAVMAAGDIDGDGKDDLAISEPGADVTTGDSGAVLLYRLGANGPELIRPVLSGLGAGRFGSALAIVDVDNDGDKDLVVGSPNADIAAGVFNNRGVLDIFLLQKGGAISDSPSIRIGGIDLAADGTLRPFTALRSARGVVAADFNDDGLTDLVTATSVSNSLLGGSAVAKSQIAFAVYFGRAAAKRFNDTPDTFIMPSTLTDTTEGNWRMGLAAKTPSAPARLMVAADQGDAPNLTASGGTAGGSNAGVVLLYDLRSQRATGGAPASPVQLGPSDAFARIYGDAANVQASRSFVAADLDNDGALELVVSAPYASVTEKINNVNVTTPLVGKLMVYPLGGLTAGAQVNKPTFTRFGQGRADALGTALVQWGTALVTVAGRASTALGDFTGRIDSYSGTGDLASWSVTSAPIPNTIASQLIGAAVDVAVVGGALRAVVGAPGFSGPAADSTGSDIDAGQALLFDVVRPASPRVIAEGAAGPSYRRDGGWSAFGGRGVGVDVAMTDFNHDGQPDVVVAAPNFSPPFRIADGGGSSLEYATLRPECLSPSAQTPGGAFIHLGRADGTFTEGFRVWAMRDVPGAADGGLLFTRSQLGRGGIIGGFDFNGDGTQDVGLTRGTGIEIIGGRVADDSSLSKLTMACDPLFSLPQFGAGNQYATAPSALGDIDGDGCDEVGFRYTDNSSRSGVVVAFGFGASCSRTTASWVRISGDTEAGLNNMRLGVAITRAGKIMANDNRDFIAVTADLYPYAGVAQATVLLFDIAEIIAKRPASGERLVGAVSDGLNPVPVVYFKRAPGFGRMLSNGDVNGDGKTDLVVSAPGANVNGDGTGAVFVFGAGTMQLGPNFPMMTIVSDQRERAAFGQDVSVAAKVGTVVGAMVIGAPSSYRSGTSNGTAYVLPLDF